MPSVTASFLAFSLTPYPQQPSPILLERPLHAVSDRFFPGFLNGQSLGPHPLTHTIPYVFMVYSILQGKQVWLKWPELSLIKKLNFMRNLSICCIKDTSYTWAKRIAKMSNFRMFCSIILLIHHLSKIWMILFWSLVHRWKWCSNTWKLPSGERAEIKNLKVCNFFLHFQFQPCHQRVFFNYDPTLLIYGQFFKKKSFRFLKDWTELRSKISRMCSFLPHE